MAITQYTSESNSPKLIGKLDLSRIFVGETIHDSINLITLYGTSVAYEGYTACAMLGTPRIDDPVEKNVETKSTPTGLLNAWKNFGFNITSHIHGKYAFVIVDVKQRSVFMAVDRFAAETLCYRIDGSTISFSDRANCVPDCGNDLDPQALFDYLYFHMIPAPRTVFRNVKRLPGAHALLMNADGVKEIRHWPLNFDEHHREPFDNARNTFRQLIRDSVAEEIEGHSHVGAFLSGGTDSSTVAGMLGQITGNPTQAYSIGFEAEGYDEMEYARIAARHFGCKHHEYYVTPADLVASMPAVAQHHDQPFGNSSALPAYYCAKMAQSDGCTKMLAGDGGDELFGGNSRYATQRFFEFYHSVPKGMRRLIEPMCGDDSILRKIPGLRQATGYVRHSRIPMPDRMMSFNLIMHLDPAKVLTPAFLAKVDLAEPSAHMRNTWGECSAPCLINRMLAYDWRYTLADSDLPKVRGATDMAGVSVGYPLLSDRLTDFSMSLPPEWKLRRFKLRWFFKEALRGYLPDEIITKKKKGFGLPFGVWAARDAGLKQLAGESLHGLAERGIIREDFARKLMPDYLPEHPGYYGEMVWILTMLEQWLRQHVPKYSLPAS